MDFIIEIAKDYNCKYVIWNNKHILIQEKAFFGENGTKKVSYIYIIL